MTIDCSTFGATEPFEVTLPGGTIAQCVPVTLRDERVLAKAHPQPQPPHNKQPKNTGSSAPMIANLDDPQYIEHFGQWYDQDAIAKVAISTGYRHHEHGTWAQVIEQGDEQVARWISAVSDELEELLCSVWVGAFLTRLERAALGGLGELVDRAGLGNSGTPSA